MKPSRLFWHLFPSSLLVSLLAVLSATLYGVHVLRRADLRRTLADLEAQARLLAPLVASLADHDAAAIDALCKQLGRRTGTRFTVVLPSGTVAGDSREHPASMDNHARRPEVAEALGGRVGVSSRFSRTRQQQLLYVAAPVWREGRVVAVARAAQSLNQIESEVADLRAQMWLAAAGLGGLLALVSLGIARRWLAPLTAIQEATERLARGDWSARVPPLEGSELAAMGQAINRMAEEMEQRLRIAVRERDEKEAALEGLAEGVLVLDDRARVVAMNTAAERWLQVRLADVRGRSFQEVIRNAPLQEFIERALQAATPLEAEIDLRDEEDRGLRVYGRHLRPDGDQAAGVLIVLHDTTALRRLERVRQEFVANVSHELRTPIASAKAAIETLRTAGLETREEREALLDMAQRHVDRLGRLVEDLLTLSRLESGADRLTLRRERTPIELVLMDAAGPWKSLAAQRGIRIEIRADSSLEADLNVPLFQQAVSNLIDNAIKASGDNSTVWVTAEREANELAVRVRDEGCGIESEHLPRLFERFYRVDKARSRKLGGTGLGLAIVKHVVLVHGGTVSVESSPGRGSTFTIRLPLTES